MTNYLLNEEKMNNIGICEPNSSLQDEKIGIFSSLVFIFIPITIRWAPTTSQGPIFLFFSALTVLAFLCYFKTEKNKILLFSFTLLAYTIQIRTESILLIAIIALMFILLHHKNFEHLFEHL